ncbi:MAG: hypothetical protein LKI21_07530 [Bifidobacterium crudilactis]|nr:hypothetical protein [Bifidobacterium crudilactis]
MVSTIRHRLLAGVCVVAALAVSVPAAHAAVGEVLPGESRVVSGVPGSVLAKHGNGSWSYTSAGSPSYVYSVAPPASLSVGYERDVDSGDVDHPDHQSGSYVLERGSDEGTSSSMPSLGVTRHQGTAYWIGSLTDVSPADEADTEVRIPFDYTTGSKVTLPSGGQWTSTDVEFYRQASGVWHASASGSQWSADISDVTGLVDISPSIGSLTLSNGTVLDIDWGQVSSTADGATLHAQVPGVATGTVVGQDVSVSVTLRADFSTTETRSATVDGKHVSLAKTGDDWSGVIELDEDPSGSPGDTAVKHTEIVKGSQHGIYKEKDETYPLSLASSGVVVDYPKLGVAHRVASATLTGSLSSDQGVTSVSASHETTSGSEITLSSGQQFTADGDGVWQSVAPNIALGQDNVPESDKISLSDGSRLEVEWGAVSQREIEGLQYAARTGVASGSLSVEDSAGVSHEQLVRVQVTASRTWDDAFKGLSLSATDATGQSSDITLSPAFDASGTSWGVTLDDAHALDSYSLSVHAGPDAVVSSVSKKLGAKASRVFDFTVNGVARRVTVSFVTSDLVADGPAKLDGIFVNASGNAERGELIANWDANRLDYVIQIGRTDPSPYILPVAADGVSMHQGDIEQTGDASRISWTASRDGVSRVYTVTVVREHDPNAVERFEPGEPLVNDEGGPADSPADTTLSAVGYTLNGRFTPAASAAFEVPEGGVFTVQPRVGQSVSVSGVRVKGMTWRYEVTVLSPDGSAVARHSFDATYITEPTHRARLTGIMVNGTPVDGFAPGVFEYGVEVGDEAQWTVIPVFDKDTGMSVSTHKEGLLAVITVTSADGLVVASYTVSARVVHDVAVVGVGESLATTGANVFVALFVALVLGSAGGLLIWWGWNHSPRKSSRREDESEGAALESK